MDQKEGVMKEVQKTQNKLLRFLNKSRIADKINTGSILEKLKMLSVNQLNAQIKLTETWKALNANTPNAISNLRIEQKEGQ